jgi:hypothetical protein
LAITLAVSVIPASQPQAKAAAASVRGCALQGFDSNGISSSDIANTSGNQYLDQLIVRELNWLAGTFGVKPIFFMLNDSDGPNAYAMPKVVDHRFPDGTVLFGFNLMMQEFRSSRTGQGFAIPAIMAHEFAHIVQFKMGVRLPTKQMELQADILAGWYMANRSNFIMTDATEALYSFFNKGDYNFNDPTHHGTPEERLRAVQIGIELRLRGASIGQAYQISLQGLSNGSASGGGNNHGAMESSGPQLFFTAAGLSYGDTIEDVERIYGEPEEVRQSRNLIHLSYMDGGLVISCNANTGAVKFIDLSSEEAVAALKERGLMSASLSLFGKHRNSILKALGQPGSVEVADHIYQFSNGSQRCEVTFTCYDHEDYICSNIVIFWK